MKLQKTIKGEGQVSGKGLFGGQDVQVVFKPAPDIVLCGKVGLIEL